MTEKIHVRAEVFAGAGVEDLKYLGNNKFRIWVREQPKNNMANRRVVELVAGHYAVLPGAARIVKGHKSPRKILEIHLQ